MSDDEEPMQLCTHQPTGEVRPCIVCGSADVQCYKRFWSRHERVAMAMRFHRFMRCNKCGNEGGSIRDDFGKQLDKVLSNWNNENDMRSIT